LLPLPPVTELSVLLKELLMVDYMFLTTIKDSQVFPLMMIKNPNMMPNLIETESLVSMLINILPNLRKMVMKPTKNNSPNGTIP